MNFNLNFYIYFINIDMLLIYLEIEISIKNSTLFLKHMCFIKTLIKPYETILDLILASYIKFCNIF